MRLTAAEPQLSGRYPGHGTQYRGLQQQLDKQRCNSRHRRLRHFARPRSLDYSPITIGDLDAGSNPTAAFPRELIASTPRHKTRFARLRSGQLHPEESQSGICEAAMAKTGYVLPSRSLFATAPYHRGMSRLPDLKLLIPTTQQSEPINNNPLLGRGNSPEYADHPRSRC